jgi:hypothetical protein
VSRLAIQREPLRVTLPTDAGHLLHLVETYLRGRNLTATQMASLDPLVKSSDLRKTIFCVQQEIGAKIRCLNTSHASLPASIHPDCPRDRSGMQRAFRALLWTTRGRVPHGIAPAAAVTTTCWRFFGQGARVHLRCVLGIRLCRLVASSIARVLLEYSPAWRGTSQNWVSRSRGERRPELSRIARAPRHVVEAPVQERRSVRDMPMI